MNSLTARLAFGAIGLWFAILCSGCAWWDRTALTDAVSRTPPATTLTVSNDAEDFDCDLVLRRSSVRVVLASAMDKVAVQKGDTLGAIALRTYGDRARAMDIARANNIANPDLIFPGQILDLPQTERRCTRTQHREVSYRSNAGGGGEASRPLERRLFSPPSARQPEQRLVRATSSDPWPR